MKKLIKRIKEDVKFMRTHNNDMDEASFWYEKGILLSGNEAKILISAIKKNMRDAARYRWLRDQNVLTPDNEIVNGCELDDAVDSRMKKQA